MSEQIHPPNTQLPPSTTTVLVFDTNAYIDLVDNLSLEQCRALAEQMRAAAHDRREAILASPTVIWELVTHLADTSDPSYGRCMKALVFLAHHTEAWGAADHRLQCVPFGSALMCHALFGEAAPNDTANADALQKMAVHARINAPDLSDPAFKANAIAFSTTMSAKEKAWLEDMKQLIAALEPSNATRIVGDGTDDEIRKRLRGFFADKHFLPKYSRELVERHAATLGKEFSEQEVVGRVDFIGKTFEAPYRMFAGLMDKVTAPSGINVESRKRKWWNFIWDQDICYLLGPEHFLKDCAVNLVTGDGAFKTAAVNAGCGQRVLTLTEYQAG